MNEQEYMTFSDKPVSLNFYPEVDRMNTQMLTELRNAQDAQKVAERADAELTRENELYGGDYSLDGRRSYEKAQRAADMVAERKQEATVFAELHKDELLQNALTTAAINGISITHKSNL